MKNLHFGFSDFGNFFIFRFFIFFSFFLSILDHHIDHGQEKRNFEDKEVFDATVRNNIFIQNFFYLTTVFIFDCISSNVIILS
jgi:hypothetical protein